MTVILGVFVWLLGLCIGSFLNVVVYRLPRGLSINQPRRSFCPACETPIAATDNIPVLSWLLLRGRCRKCRAPISSQYPLVEAATGAAFVLVYYLIAIADARAGVSFALPRDAALLAAWLLLAATMIACSAMDVVAYMIDVRVTDFCLIAALLLHGMWPAPLAVRETATTAGSAAAAAILVASGVMLYLTVWRKPGDEPTQAADTPQSSSPSPNGASGQPGSAADQPKRVKAKTEPETFAASENAACARSHAIAGRIGIGAFIALPAVMMLLIGAPVQSQFSTWATAAGVAAFFIAIVLAGAVKREADTEIHEAIEQEGPLARRTALREVLWLAPIILAGAAAYLAVDQWPAGRAAWQSLVGIQIGEFVPVAAITHSALGVAVGAAAGWALRIVFTLVFGREAFGTGDIYILAAAGAVCGWDLVLVGLLCSVGLALLGWLIGLALKSGVMIPFGPWLAIGFVVGLWISRPFFAIVAAYADNIRAVWDSQPRALWLAGGLLLAGSVAAVVIARLLRVWLESRFRSDTAE